MFSINTSSNPVNLFYVLPLRSSLRPSLYSKSTIDILWEINSSFVSLVYIDYLSHQQVYHDLIMELFE